MESFHSKTAAGGRSDPSKPSILLPFFPGRGRRLAEMDFNCSAGNITHSLDCGRTQNPTFIWLRKIAGLIVKNATDFPAFFCSKQLNGSPEWKLKYSR